MRRFLSALAVFVAAALLSGTPVFGRNVVRDVAISLNLQADGTANVTEVWMVDVTEGTEWYLVRENLGDIVVEGLSVSDETGHKYLVEPEWNSDRPRSEKARRCGLIHKRKGVEICWGIGDYGSRVYKVSYRMTRAVKTLRDADMLHLQLLSPGISSKPQHVSVRISAPGLTKENVRFWGFGFEGQSWFESGSVRMETTGCLRSVIALLRFEKGLFNSPSVQNRRFEDVLAEALDGAHFEDEGDEDDDAFLGMLFSLIMTLAGAFTVVAGAITSKRRVLGCRPSQVDWCRDVPYGGDLLAANYTLGRLGEIKKGSSFASAMILRMIYRGALETGKAGENKVDIYFNDEKASGLDPEARELYDMLKAASGSDLILQDKEFSRWSKRNWKRVNKWVTDASERGSKALRGLGHIGSYFYTDAGKAEARKLLGFKKFLSDFTLVKERGSREVGLWQDYLVYASLFGIADQVAKELHDIDPQLFEETVAMDYNRTSWLLWHNNQMATAITNAQVRASQAMGRTSGSFGGFGGGTSFGGGGGFSGGGFGGGAR
ncbi:MAG: DUF2207 domain-containing protein [Bacteroidales bacterium]|nr:DUF2207 domain-containing protein [Bacteroidales bacterium]